MDEKAMPELFEATGGWIAWDGGECPVQKDVLVEARLALPELSDITTRKAQEWDWSKTGDETDIVSYRIAAPKEGQL